MAEFDLESIIKSGVEKALNTTVHGGKTITEWAAIGMKNGGGWISVKDRLPEPPAQCLVYSDKAYRPRGMETATYTKLGWMTAAYFPEITHWMPLPEPPEEAKP